MALSQAQIIRSLGDALAWFERELAWGVKAAELGHLTGRIGELYAAMITRGQMALAVNQHGYDVVGKSGDRISVKTVTTSSQVTLRKSTFHHIDRVIILRINSDEGEVAIEELLDCSASEFLVRVGDTGGDYVFRVRSNSAPARPLADMVIVAEAQFEDERIVQYENGTVMVYRTDVPAAMAKPLLRAIAAQTGVPLLNGNGNPMNTRQLGAEIITALNARRDLRNLTAEPVP